MRTKKASAVGGPGEGEGGDGDENGAGPEDDLPQPEARGDVREAAQFFQAPGVGARCGAPMNGKGGGKAFFFEKKKQKTFVRLEGEGLGLALGGAGGGLATTKVGRGEAFRVRATGFSVGGESGASREEGLGFDEIRELNSRCFSGTAFFLRL